MRRLREIVEKAGATEATVLIVGESGTGKELVARGVHDGSARAKKPFVALNCGALPGSVVQSELFGHEKGAFTGASARRIGLVELANGGTLFLDEIGELPLDVQVMLLRLLEEKRFFRVGGQEEVRADVRFVAATNRDLEAEVAAGRFREDLFFRLNTVELHLPPLRDRREDIPLLASFFLRQAASRYRSGVTSIDPEAMRALLAYGWPGNVRELGHAIERATLLATGDRITTAELNFRPMTDTSPRLDEMSLEDVERVLITKALARHDGNVTLAARALGLSRSALYRRLQRHGL
jgi:DNA-binding NtrC family response regulator